MINNVYCKCNICETTLRLRFQVGYSNIPVNIHCPNCGILIHGLIKINQEEVNIDYEINNISFLNTDEQPEYLIELSSEFLQKKTCKNTEDIDLSMYFRNFATFGMKNIENLIQLIHISKEIPNIKNYITIYSNLWKNRKTDLLIKELSNYTNPYINMLKSVITNYVIKNDIDVFMAMHQCISLMLDETLVYKIKIKKNNIMKEVLETFNKDKHTFIEFIKFLDTHDYFKSSFNKISDLILIYLDEFNKIIPVMNVCDDIDKIDLTIYGVTTVSFENMKKFYSNCYESLCDFIDLIVGLNNLHYRGSFNIFPGETSSVNFLKKINSYNSKINKYNALLEINELYSEEFLGLLDNKIRNAIAHNSISFDSIDQIIQFKNIHKGSSREVKLYLIEFIMKCINMYQAIILLNEYFYQIEKIKITLEGNIPNYGILHS